MSAFYSDFVGTVYRTAKAKSTGSANPLENFKKLWTQCGDTPGSLDGFPRLEALPVVVHTVREGVPRTASEGHAEPLLILQLLRETETLEVVQGHVQALERYWVKEDVTTFTKFRASVSASARIQCFFSPNILRAFASLT